jgi:hypothetical protein
MSTNIDNFSGNHKLRSQQAFIEYHVLVVSELKKRTVYLLHSAAGN